MSVASDERTEMGNIILDGPKLEAIRRKFNELQTLVATTTFRSESAAGVADGLAPALSDLRHDCGIDAVLEKVHTG